MGEAGTRGTGAQEAARGREETRTPAAIPVGARHGARGRPRSTEATGPEFARGKTTALGAETRRCEGRRAKDGGGTDESSSRQPGSRGGLPREKEERNQARASHRGDAGTRPRKATGAGSGRPHRKEPMRKAGGERTPTRDAEKARVRTQKGAKGGRRTDQTAE